MNSDETIQKLIGETVDSMLEKAKAAGLDLESLHYGMIWYFCFATMLVVGDKSNILKIVEESLEEGEMIRESQQNTPY